MLSEQQLSSEVGSRVRRARESKGFSRKQLAQLSNVSERYLAQLEGGKANISLNLLARTVGPLGVTLHDVIPNTSADQHGLCGIALIGLRGAGKSTLGELAARATGLPFVRLTQAISTHVGMNIAEFMELGGMDAFRRAEHETLTKLAGKQVPVILETSGGIADAKDSFDLLLSRFHTVWIKADPDEHMNRVLAQNDLRPVAGRTGAMAELRELLAQREPAYARANAIIETSGKSIEASTADLVGECQRFLARTDGPVAVPA